jgi:hypothetical protein
MLGGALMTEDDKSFLKEFLTRSRFIGIIVGVFILFIALSIKENTPVKSQSTKVLGTYKGCDVIEWHYGPLAEYKYFLYCNNTRPVYEQ